MTQEQILQNNKLIAEFMNMPQTQLYSSPGIYSLIWRNPNTNDLTPVRYHTSWDWLMPVVEKIANNSPDHEVEIEIGRTFATFKIRDLDDGRSLYGINEFSDADKPIEAIYKGVLKFITWYNSHKK